MTTLRNLILLCLSLALVAEGFAPQAVSRVAPTTTCLPATPVDVFQTSSTHISAATLDPTTFLSDLLGAFISSNAILAVPIVAALALASLVAFAIVAYANPAEPEDD